MRAMLVGDLGEFQLIDLLAKTVADGSGQCVERLSQIGFRLLLPIGDDAAAWDAPAGVRVLTTDTMVEGVHFRLAHRAWRDLGWKSMAANLSDLAAMGCTPLYSVVTLGLRGDLPVEGMVDLYKGMLEACQSYGGAIVGGDVVRSPVLFVTVAMEGTAVALTQPGAKDPALLTRASASPGDVIAVTGSLGCSAGGLRMLAEARDFDAETAGHLKSAHNRPIPRVPQGVALAQGGVATAIDISDGLVDDLAKVCAASGVGAVVQTDRVPSDRFLKRAYPQDWITLALGGGEDYELLFTTPAAIVDEVASKLGVPVSIIGDIVEGPPEVRVLDQQGEVVPVQHGGWDHFRRPRV